MRSFRIALVYNPIKIEMLINRPIDVISEYDSEETVNAIKMALETGGHHVYLVEADENIFDELKKVKPDIVFNIAEGKGGEAREAYVPCILEMLGIPYTGSGPLTLALCLNKARTKQILTYYGIPTAKFQVVRSSNEDLDERLKYPLIVKLLHEGSSMGLAPDSVVYTEEALRKKVEYLLRTYGEPVLVEEFLPGREFTVPILGNEKLELLPIIEIVYETDPPINLFTPDRSTYPLLKQIYGSNLNIIEWDNASICPASVDEELRQELESLAVKAFRAMECRDWCRVEIRLNRNGVPHILELNPIAGLDPSYWFPKSARAAGMSYEELINRILYYALKRYELI